MSRKRNPAIQAWAKRIVAGWEPLTDEQIAAVAQVAAAIDARRRSRDAAPQENR